MDETQKMSDLELKEDILSSFCGHLISVVLAIFFILGAIGTIDPIGSIFVAFGVVFAIMVVYVIAEKFILKKMVKK